MIGQRTGARIKPSETPGAGLRTKRVVHLVREELSGKSLSYAVTALAAALFGLINPAGGSLEEGARSGGFLVDFFFLAMLAVLSVNVFSRSYFRLHRDPFHGWLAFLRGLPVSPKEMVLARSLVMLPATLVMTALFLAPLAVFSSLLDPRFGVGQFLWFALVWLGYALAAGGMNLYLELGVKGKVVMALQLVWLVAMVAVVWLLGGNLVFSTFDLAGEHGPLVAGAALLAGGAVFALFAKATERRVAGREFVA